MNIKQLALSFASLVIRLALMTIVVLAVIRLGKQAYDFGFKLFTEESMDEPPGRDIVVTVNADDGMLEISQMLEEKGLTSDWKLFFLQSKLSENKDPLKPGSYTLNTSMNADTMLMILEDIEPEEPIEDLGEGDADELTEQSLDDLGSSTEDDNFDIYGYNGDGSEGEIISPEIVEDEGE
ncbi:MAG: hypothetical protein K6G83_08070 [Lachnospiraceae bacterium]|nr:hypothetical protein [Lachnospiraceae bacterium]